MLIAVIPVKNDNFGGLLLERAYLSLSNNSITFDHIILVDWKVRYPVGPFIDSLISKYPDIIDKIKNNNCRFEVLEVPYHWIETNVPEFLNYAIVESWARNLGLMHAIKEYWEEDPWICSTNIDVLIEPFNTKTLDIFGLYTSRRYNVDTGLAELFSVEVPLNLIKSNKGRYKQAPIASNLVESFWDEGDLWSLTVSCGDFQLASGTSWICMEGFEEKAAGRSYADSNLMKKAHLLSFETKILDIFVGHLNHGYESNRTSEEILPLNDQKSWVQDFELPSKNTFWLENICSTTKRVIEPRIF